LAVFLSQATRVVPGDRATEVLAISPDGKSAAVRSPDGIAVQGLATHNRLPLGADPIPRGYLFGSPDVAWSPDGKRVAYATEEEIVVITLEPKQTRRLKIRAGQFALGPGEEDIIVCTKERISPVPPRFAVSRLERVKLADGSRQTLVDFPLCRVAHPVLSPDGRRIALVSNRDYPRTATAGGHLYVGAADGSNLRQLTRDPEEIGSVAWSADGKHLYATRRLVVGDDGAVGLGGSSDLFRISAETGKAENLTRSGGINRAWCVGSDVLLEITAWDASPAQRGIFRIALEQLEKATASRPLRPSVNPRTQAKAVAVKVQAAVGETPLEEVLPNPALLERAAQGFVDGIRESFGVELDFSAASIDRLASLLPQTDLASGRELGMIFGFGAYYGETLRKVAGAEWRIRPLRFGAWKPAGLDKTTTALAEVVLPFSELYRSALQVEDDRLRRAPDVLEHKEGQKLVLVYPPAYAEEAVREATGTEYYQALKMLDAGEVKPALGILTAGMQRRPKNRALAREVIALCEAARMPEAANELIRKAVEAGNEVPELLLRYADLLAKKDPQRALQFYRRAVQGEQAPAEAFIKLGEQLQGLGQTAVAESCWRRAYANATEPEKQHIRKLMGLPPENENRQLGKASDD
jgi:tetratricopeptide (TPR) repeat protein